jgi:hypothetical protein
MTLDRYGLLKQVLAQLRPGQPLTARWLAGHGVSAQLAHHYVRAGWLTRLGYGYFLRPGDEPDLQLSLAILPGAFHVGGKTALEWHGYQHNLSHRQHVELFSEVGMRLPDWMRARFSIGVRRRHLFDDPVLGVEAWRDLPSLRVAEPERAVLEMLCSVPQHQSLEEAAHLVESLYGLRAGLMQPLLESCRSIKAVRLFFRLSEQASLPVLEELDPGRINRGSATPYVRKHASSTMRF